MTKIQFLLALDEMLAALPEKEAEERIAFYVEMIEDRMEEGLSEEEAVASVGAVEELAQQILAESSEKKSAKPKKQRKAGQIVLLVLGSPLWIALLAAAFAVVLALFVSLWAVIIAFWAVFASLAACAFGTTVAGVGFALNGKLLPGIAMIGAGIVCAGLTIFAFYGCKAATKGAVVLTGLSARWIKKCFTKKEDAQ